MNLPPSAGQKLNPYSGYSGRIKEKKEFFCATLLSVFRIMMMHDSFSFIFWALVGKGQFSGKNERLELAIELNNLFSFIPMLDSLILQILHETNFSFRNNNHIA